MAVRKISYMFTIYIHQTDLGQVSSCLKENCNGRYLCLFVLMFYGPVNPMGSCLVQSVYLTTLLLGRLSPLSG